MIRAKTRVRKAEHELEDPRPLKVHVRQHPKNPTDAGLFILCISHAMVAFSLFSISTEITQALDWLVGDRTRINYQLSGIRAGTVATAESVKQVDQQLT